MPDKPLFQNSDDHEKTYAPGQLPDANDQNADQAALDDAPLAVPAAGVLGSGLEGATGPGSGNVGTGLPSAASAELASETSDDSDAPDQS